MTRLYEFERQLADALYWKRHEARGYGRRLGDAGLLPRNPRGKRGPSREMATTSDAAYLVTAYLDGAAPMDAPDAVRWARETVLTQITEQAFPNPAQSCPDAVSAVSEAIGGFTDALTVLIDAFRIGLWLYLRGGVECQTFSRSSLCKSFALRTQHEKKTANGLQEREQVLSFGKPESEIDRANKATETFSFAGSVVFETTSVVRCISLKRLHLIAKALGTPSEIEAKRIRERADIFMAGLRKGLPNNLQALPPGARIMSKETVDYYGQEILRAFNAGVFPREELEKLCKGGAQAPRNEVGTVKQVDDEERG